MKFNSLTNEIHVVGTVVVFWFAWYICGSQFVFLLPQMLKNYLLLHAVGWLQEPVRNKG